MTLLLPRKSSQTKCGILIGVLLALKEVGLLQIWFSIESCLNFIKK